MSTRSLVGAETESGIKMVYVHCDGYPEAKIPNIQALVKRDGVSKVVTTLLESPSGWSSFDGEPGEELGFGHDNERFELVPGYGVRYTLTEITTGSLGSPSQPYVQGNKEYATPEDAHEYWDIQYVYVISADGKELKWALHSDTPWDELEWITEPLVES